MINHIHVSVYVACIHTFDLSSPLPKTFSASAIIASSSSFPNIKALAMINAIIKLGWEATPAAKHVAGCIERVLAHYDQIALTELSLVTVNTPLDLFKVATTVEQHHLNSQWLERDEIATACTAPSAVMEEVVGVQEARTILASDSLAGFEISDYGKKTTLTELTLHFLALTRCTNYVIMREGASLATLLRVLRERIANADAFPEVIIIVWGMSEVISSFGLIKMEVPNLKE